MPNTQNPSEKWGKVLISVHPTSNQTKNLWLPTEQVQHYELSAQQDECEDLASLLGIVSLQKLSASVSLRNTSDGLHLQGEFQMNWQDHCVSSGVVIPLTLHKELDMYLKGEDYPEEELKDNQDTISLEDDHFDLAALLLEYVSLDMPDYPRDSTLAADPNEGAEPLSSRPPSEIEKTQPFAGLADLLATKGRPN